MYQLGKREDAREGAGVQAALADISDGEFVPETWEGCSVETSRSGAPNRPQPAEASRERINGSESEVTSFL
jgi:hypothetical protein